MIRSYGLLALVGLCILSGCQETRRSAVADGKLTVRPGQLDFARVALYSGRIMDVKVENLGRGPVEIHGITLEGPDRTYSVELVDGHSFPHRLSLGETCDLRLRFRPKDPGELPAKLVITSDSRGQERLEIPIRGLGVDARAVVPQEPLEFGRIEVLMDKPLSLPFKNPSPLPVKIHAEAIGADKDEFVVEPLSLEPGEEKTANVHFRPVRAGNKRAMLSVATCEGCPPVFIPLRAVGLEQAVVPEPPELDFGPLPVDREMTEKLIFRNISTEPMVLTGLGIEQGSDPSFSVGSHGFPHTLQPWGTVEYPVRFSPTHMGVAQGVGAVAVVSKKNPHTRVQLRAFGGTSELCVSPLSHDFGEKPVGAKETLRVSLKNCGAPAGQPLVIERLYMGDGTTPTGPMADGSDQFSIAGGNSEPQRTLAAGEEMVVNVYFEPTRPGAASNTLHVETSLESSSHLRIPLTGTARQLPPCQLEVTPGAIDFGTIPPGQGAVLGVKVQNRGTDLCAVKNIRITDSGGDVFRMPGGEIAGHLVDPGWGFTFQVAAVLPRGGGTFVGALQIGNADPANPVITVPLSVHSQSSCLVASPHFVDFGFARPDCPPAPRVVTVENACPQPVTLGDVSIGPGSTDGEFELGTRTGTPTTLLPGETATVTVSYAAQVEGMNLSPLFFHGAGLPRPLLVPLIGESHADGQQHEQFVQQDGSKVDVLFVVDNTSSMYEEQERLTQALPSFIDAARQRGVDLQVAVTTTGIQDVGPMCPGGAEGGEAGRLFPADGSRARILHLGMADVTERLQENAQVGFCANKEEGLEAVRRALSPPLVNQADDPRTPLANDGNAGFLRESAGIAVVFVSDEDDHSPDPVDRYVQFLRSVKGMNQPHRAVIYAIAPDGNACATAGGSGTRYAEAARKTGGEVLSICAPDYGPALRSLASKAFAPQSRFPLAETPDAQGVRVFLDGQESLGGWIYDPLANAVIFQNQPAPGVRVDIHYRKKCS